MFKKHILSLKRYQTSENRDVLNGIILDRNERADHYDKKEFNSVLNKIPRFSLNATPDISLLYKKIAKLASCGSSISKMNLDDDKKKKEYREELKKGEHFNEEKVSI